MKDHDVPGADRIPNIRCSIKRRNRQRDLNAVFESRNIRGGIKLQQIRESGEPLAGIQILSAQLELLNKLRQQLFGKIRIILKADGMRREYLEAMIEARQIMIEYIFQQHECVLSLLGWKLNESRHHLSWNIHDGELGVRQGRSDLGPQRYDQTKRTVGQIRKRMAGINGQGGHDRIERPTKELFQKSRLLAGHFFRTKQMDAFGCKLRQNRLEK